MKYWFLRFTTGRFEYLGEFESAADAEESVDYVGGWFFNENDARKIFESLQSTLFTN